jgi:hypothetical protein
MTDNIVKLEPRRLTNAELRGAVSLLMHAIVFGRQSIGKWLVKHKAPTQRELMNLAMELESAEKGIANLVKGPPTDGHALDELINDFILWREKLQSEVISK